MLFQIWILSWDLVNSIKFILAKLICIFRIKWRQGWLVLRLKNSGKFESDYLVAVQYQNIILLHSTLCKTQPRLLYRTSSKTTNHSAFLVATNRNNSWCSNFGNSDITSLFFYTYRLVTHEMTITRHGCHVLMLLLGLLLLLLLL